MAQFRCSASGIARPRTSRIHTDIPSEGSPAGPRVQGVWPPIYTKDGRPLQRSGRQHIQRKRHACPETQRAQSVRPGREVCGDARTRPACLSLNRRSEHGPPFARQSRAGSVTAREARSALWGDEPPVPD